MAPDRTPAKAHGNAFGNAFGKVFIATSVDGFIARPDGSLDWLPAGGDGGEDYGYAAFMKTVDGIVMGRSTYESVLGFDGWPFEKPVVVMSRTLGAGDVPAHLRGKLRITSVQPAQLVAELRAEGWSSAYIDGGAVIRAFLAAGEIGEMTITRVPVLIGAGRPLFGDIGCDLRLTCLASQAYPSGMVSTRYRVEAGGRVMVRNGGGDE
ncbi:dihydrofolate reductase [Delftia acidovorans]|uniref:dihydrofolate reductase family protein n=1 Tax=Delftia acidovorans TaxID=80866 RepID=UPI000F4C3752|nr:dihydrofolate reductase family protein [Delftia acidovorans]ROR02341.1 dihydrofolate reductase [Delftia acidovorans]